ncbi:mechanosensitive ion channel family protein [Mucilaginibacter sp. X4EP1]|uniref:mechanosensitive ion channel family protein n=1 Tax=Mucilaginibacter sp. X4EP1 TaxID=2723092 RepID=UPI00216764C2|nr:mechanosensitive ion channel domain-containing protein [Mucilaginibacter sp. X4EP1]MCS3814039.1 small-conductance mechanosensitive channel [Mucilaginibacter sp. X4EP1]
MKSYLIFIFLIILSFNASAQQPDTNALVMPDTIKSNLTKTIIKHTADSSGKESFSRFKEDIIATRQDGLIENIRQVTQTAKNYLKIGIDTAQINADLDSVANLYGVIGDGVFTNKGTAQTNRNISTSSILFNEVLNKTLTSKAIVDKYYKKLVNFRNEIDSLASSSILYQYPTDSVALKQYLQKIAVTSMEIRPTDTALKKALFSVKALQTKINFITNRLSSRIEELDAFQKNLSGQIFSREFANIWDSVGYTRPLNQIIKVSAIKMRLVIYFYLRNNTGKVMLLFVLALLSTVFIRSLKQRLAVDGLLNSDFRGQSVLRYPFLSAILIVLTVFQFIFPRPPFIFSAFIWAISSLSLLTILRDYITKFWMRASTVMFVLFLLACADDLILQATRSERWGMLLLSLTGAGWGIFVLLSGKRNELKESWIIYAMWVFVVVEVLSAINNIYGRYNLSKALLTAGFFNVIIAVLFLWAVRLTDQGISWAFNVYKVPDKRLFFVNFDRVGTRAPLFFYVFMIGGWAFLFGRNFYAFRSMFKPIESFLVDVRTIGHYSFTINSILVFFTIIVLSSLISKVVSFFASDKYDIPAGANKTGGGLGSWLLLIRIAIITIGLFLAFAAAGIPTDRITIVLSALGVGIGFGLQTLINNLVSGLIISFEKPVNVGDIIELGDKGGTMKSIGFRSSIIATWDGADVIVPNGDLLNQHLVNWTLDNRTRRIDFQVSVAYGTDISKTKEIINKLIVADKRILKKPAPAIMIKDLGPGTISLQVFFWARDIGEWSQVRSDLIGAVEVAFRDNKIDVPFPQQEIRIRPAQGNEEENK